MDFYLSMHNDRFKGFAFFEDALYTGISRYSSSFHSEARNIGNRDGDIFS